jgi:hypothetical protein
MDEQGLCKSQAASSNLAVGFKEEQMRIQNLGPFSICELLIVIGTIFSMQFLDIGLLIKIPLALVLILVLSFVNLAYDQTT